MTHSGLLGRVWRWVTALLRAVGSVIPLVREALGLDTPADLHTRVTFRAAIDAIVPETPELAAEFGPEHVPGGRQVGLDEFVVAYVDEGFQLGLPVVGPQGNIPLADPIAHGLDLAAMALVDSGEAEAEPDPARPLDLYGPDEADPQAVRDAAGAFARLSRHDRLRAIGRLDEVQFAIRLGPDDLFEFDAGLAGQLVVGFTELIYYSEWAGYENFDRPPSERRHPNDPAAVQSWRQTGFPGAADGYAALRGYLDAPESPLGGGEQWTTIDDAVTVSLDAGAFRENDYDTTGYEEPHPE